MEKRIVCIEWDDASFNQGYYDEKRLKDFEPVFTRTVGHLIKTTAEAVFLSHERSYNTEGKPPDDRHISTIPKKMIKRIVYLKEEE